MFYLNNKDTRTEIGANSDGPYHVDFYAMNYFMYRK